MLKLQIEKKFWEKKILGKILDQIAQIEVKPVENWVTQQVAFSWKLTITNFGLLQSQILVTKLTMTIFEVSRFPLFKRNSQFNLLLVEKAFLLLKMHQYSLNWNKFLNLLELVLDKNDETFRQQFPSFNKITNKRNLILLKLVKFCFKKF